MLAKIYRNILAYRLPILAGIFIGTSYIPFPPWALAFALVPLWIFWTDQTRVAPIWWSGWITQYVLTMIGFNWVAHTIHEFGQMPWPVAALALALYCAFANLHVPLAGVLWFGLKKLFRLGPTAAFFLLPATYIFTEMSYPMIFEWHLGYPLYPTGWPIFQIAEWIGFRGLSVLVVLSNAFLFFIFQRRVRRGLLVKGLALWAVIFLFLNGLGWTLSRQLETPDRMTSALIVQANIGNLDKLEQERSGDVRSRVLQRYLDLTRQGLSGGQPTFAVWPETAYPHLLNEPYLSTHAFAFRLKTFLQENNLALITGGYGYDDATQVTYNSLYLLNSDGSAASPPYSKTYLLAFGEYIPGASLIPQFKTWLPQVGQFGRGQGPQIRHFDTFKVGPTICYEGLFADVSRELALQGAQILINLTNDSWYGTWEQPYQHLYMTLARSVELRRPILRSTNTGISTVALASGEILAQSPLHEEWYHLYELPYLESPPTTLFMSWGFYFPWVVILGLLAAALGRKKFESSR